MPQFDPNQVGGGSYSLSSKMRPDLMRQKWRGFQRQVAENEATLMDMGFAEDIRQRAKADVEQQAKTASEAVAKDRPQFEQWLPNLQKGVKGDQKAFGETMSNLGMMLPEYVKPEIDTAIEDDTLRFMSQAGPAAYQEVLARRGGGALGGGNVLDAAILARSGAGARQFAKAAEGLRGFEDIGNVLEGKVLGERKQLERDIETKKAELRKAAEGMAKGITEAGKKKQKDYAGRDVNIADIRSIADEIIGSGAVSADEANELKAYVDELAKGGKEKLAPYRQYLNREMEIASALSDPQLQEINSLMALLGGQPIIRGGKQADIQKNKVIENLITKARQRVDEMNQIRAKMADIEEFRRRQQPKPLPASTVPAAGPVGYQPQPYNPATYSVASYNPGVYSPASFRPGMY